MEQLAGELVVDYFANLDTAQAVEKASSVRTPAILAKLASKTVAQALAGGPERDGPLCSLLAALAADTLLDVDSLLNTIKPLVGDKSEDRQVRCVRAVLVHGTTTGLFPFQRAVELFSAGNAGLTFAAFLRELGSSITTERYVAFPVPMHTHMHIT